MTQPTPEQLAQTQLEAYNTRDLDAFMSVYAPDVTIFRHDTGEVMMSGHEAMRETYRQMFAASPELHCQLVNRMVMGDYVIDHEHVTGRMGAPPLDAIAIYQIKDDLISRVWFIK
jgi:hypothetical protein